MDKKVTLKEIARETGLSAMTISKYVNGVSVKKENARLIEIALKKMNYEPNAAARSLRMNRSMTIGVLISSLNDYFATTIIMGAERVLVEKGYGVIVCDYNEDSMLFERRLSFLRSKQVDGLITMAADDGGQLLASMRKDFPIIQVDYPIAGFDGDVVLSDNREASRRIVRLALSKGLRGIAIIAGKPESHTSKECLIGYREAFAEFGCEPEPSLVTYGNYCLEDGADCARKLLNRSPRPEAIYVINNSMALGMLRVFRDANITVGRDISVIGRDLLYVGDIFSPRITSVEQSLEKLGAETAKLMLRRIGGDMDSYPSCMMLRCNLIEGNSI